MPGLAASTPLCRATKSSLLRDVYFSLAKRYPDHGGNRMPDDKVVGHVQPGSPLQIIGRITQGDADSSFILNPGEWKGVCDK